MHNVVGLTSRSSAGELLMPKSGCLKCKNVIQFQKCKAFTMVTQNFFLNF